MPDRPRKPQLETPHRDKLCRTCGRTISWSEARAAEWHAPQYCSDACRGHAPHQHDATLEAAILSLLAARGPDKSICPSDAARLVGGTASLGAWQPLMEPARAAGRRLAAQGRIVVTQRGKTVDPVTAKGPIRFRLR